MASILTKRVQRNMQYVVQRAMRTLKWQQRTRQYTQLRTITLVQQQRRFLFQNEFAILSCQDPLREMKWRGIHMTNVLWSEQVVKVPPFAESISEGDIRFTCKVGDSFAADDPVMEIETDKTTVPVVAPFAGTITAILVKSGDSVKPGQDLFKMKPGGAPAKAAGAPAASAPAPAAPVPRTAPPASAPAPPVSPSAAPAAAPAASAPAKPAPAPAPGPPAAPTGPAAPGDATKKISGTRSDQRVKMTRMRQKIGVRLKEAQNTCAMLTTFNEVDMSSVMAFRKANLEAFTKQHGVKLGFMSIFSKASVLALQDQPVLNAVIDGQDIIYHDYVDISVAVATPRGLVVPVIRNVESMNYAGIEKALGALADKAKRDAITVKDMEGGTFTISNGGVFGSLLSSPIINLPQSAILGMHGIFERPIAVKGQVQIHPMMYVALTYDHRLIDGREAVIFLRKLKSFIESPAELATGL